MKKIENLAKNISLALLVYALVLGSIGAFCSSFNMSGYVDLLRGYAPLYVTLIASIGTNSVVNKLQTDKKEVSEE